MLNGNRREQRRADRDQHVRAQTRRLATDFVLDANRCAQPGREQQPKHQSYWRHR
jgi:hypothetical protein